MNIKSMSLGTKERPMRLQGSPSTAIPIGTLPHSCLGVACRLHAVPTQSPSIVCMIPRLGFLISSSTTLTMLQGTLLHTYKRYKADTDRVILWLVDNSRYKVKADVSANILPELARNVPPDHDSVNVLRMLDQSHPCPDRICCAVQVQKSPSSLQRNARAFRQHP
jgi:hypothetical protein